MTQIRELMMKDFPTLREVEAEIDFTQADLTDWEYQSVFSYQGIEITYQEYLDELKAYKCSLEIGDAWDEVVDELYS